MPQQILGPYVNHAGSCRDGAGNVFVLATQAGPGTNDDALVVLKRDVRTGLWKEIARLVELAYGKPGYGSLENVANDLHLVYSGRNSAGEQVLMTHTIPGVCESWRDAIAAQVQAAMAQYGGGDVAALATALGNALAPFEGTR